MKENTTKSAFVIIDMENGFIDERSAHCIKNAKATIPACAKAIEICHEKNIPVFFVKRQYREDGSDVELTRYQGWKKGGRSMAPDSEGFNSDEFPKELTPTKDDYIIVKPRWSAFFQTELDIMLRRLQVRNVILAGTTTPNCVRTTCYDANALEYNVVVLEDCCSSNTDEIQRVNIEDMARMGAIIMNSESFKDYDENTVEDLSKKIYQEMLEYNK